MTLQRPPGSWTLHEAEAAAPKAVQTPLPAVRTEHSPKSVKAEQAFETVGWLNLVEQKLRP